MHFSSLKLRTILSTFLCSGAVGCAGTAFAADHVWLGNSAALTESGNWSSGVAPDWGSVDYNVVLGNAAGIAGIVLDREAGSGGQIAVGGVTFSSLSPGYQIDVSNTSYLNIHGAIANLSGLAHNFTVTGDQTTGAASYISLFGGSAGTNINYTANDYGVVRLDATQGAFDGSGAAFVLNGGALALTGGNDFSVGALRGGGSVSYTGIADATLRVGGLNTNTIFTGQIDNPPSGSLALEKTGTGTLTLNGSFNSYQGGTTISEGTLQLGNGGTTGMIAGDVVNNARLSFNRADAVTFGGVISGTGDLEQNGSGTLRLTGNNSYSGRTLVNQGVLSVSGGSAIADTSAVVLSGGGRLRLEASETIGSLAGTGTAELGSHVLTTGADHSSTTFSGVAEGQGALTKTGNGVFTLSGMNTYTGTTTIDAGTLALSGQGRINRSGAVIVNGVLDVSAAASAQINNLSGSGSVSLGNASLLISNAAGTFSGAISGAGGINISSGTQVLTGSNSFAGGAGISEGATLQIGNGGTQGSVASNITNYGQLVFDRSDRAVYAGVITGPGAVSHKGTGTLVLTGNNSYSGATTIVSGRLEIGDGGTSGTLRGPVSNDGVLGFNRSGTVVYSGNISGSGSLEQMGTGTLRLTGNNSYSGRTLVNQGVLSVSGGSAIADTSAVVLSGGGRLRLETSETIGSLAGTGTAELGSHVLTTGADHSSTTFAGVAEGQGALTKTGNGVFTLSGMNTYTGTTTIDAGTLALSGQGRINRSGAVIVNGVLDVSAAASAQINNLSGSGTVSLGNASLLISNAAGTFSGAISGAGGINISSGTQVLTGSNSFAGGAGISEGATLQIGNGGTQGSVASNITNYGQLVFDRSDRAVYAGVITGPGAVSHQGTGTLVLTGNNSYSGATTIVSGRLEVGDGGTSGTLRGPVSNDGVLGFNRSGTVVYSGNISGSGSLEQMGTGTLRLTGNNSYSGRTLVSQGVLSVSGGAAIADTSAVVLSGGGRLRLDASETIGSLAGTGTAELGSHVLTTGADHSSTTFAGVAEGQGALTKTGNGVFTLSGMNTYTGTTTIDAGTLALSGQGRINRSGAVIVNGVLDVSAAASAQINNLSGSGSVSLGNASLLISNAAGTFSGAISGAGGINISSGTQVLTGSNSFAGGAGISEGATLQIGNGGTQGSVASNITNYGQLVFDRSDDVEYAGTVSGPGRFEQRGAGQLTLTGTSSSSGDVKIAAGSTLQLGNGGTTGLIGGTNFTGTITNDGTLIYNRSNQVSWAGVYAGSGAIVQAGGGSLLLTGDSSSFQGTTTVANGKLLVGNSQGTGRLGGSIDVLNGATLGGSGSLGSGNGSVVTIATGGTVSPGNSVGTLSVDGDLVFEQGARILVETDLIAARADLIHVGGDITLNGGTVAHIAAAGDYDLRASHAILAADGQLTGAFDMVTSDFAFLTPGLRYDYTAGNVELTLARNNIEFASYADTPNRRSVARAIEAIGVNAAHDVYDAIALLADDKEQIRRSFDSLTGEVHASARGVLVEQSHYVRDAIHGRLQQAFDAPSVMPITVLSYAPAGSDAAQATDGVVAGATGAVVQPYTGWGYAYGGWSKRDSDGNADEISASVGGFVTGFDAAVLDTWRLGVLAGYSHSSIHADNRASSGSVESYTLGAYAGTQWALSDQQAVALRTGLAYSWHQLDMSRTIAFPGLSDRLDADYDAGTLQLSGELGYQFNWQQARVEPYANLAYVRVRTDSFDEQGLTDAALSVRSDDMNTGYSSLGMRVVVPVPLGGLQAQASADLGWRHAYRDITPVSGARFAGSDGFSVTGLPIARDVAVIEAGFDVPLSAQARIGLSYNGQFGSGAVENGVRARLSIGF